MYKEFLTGSRLFFSEIEGFNSKDTDYIRLIPPQTNKPWRKTIHQNGRDIFEIQNLPKEQLFYRAISGRSPLSLCTFLVPGFVKEIGVTIEDLKQLESLKQRLVGKYKYWAVIYDAFILNKSFVLTDEQRLEAYSIYKNLS